MSNSASNNSESGEDNSIINQYEENLGPLLDYGAPYSAIGLVELRILLSEMCLSFPESFGPFPHCLKGFTKFQYGKDAHSSKSRKTLGSIVLTATSDTGNEMIIRHIIIDDSSQWIIGKMLPKEQ